MTDAREIAIVTALTGYDGLQAALRKRAEELNIRREDVDMLAGLAGGHAAKILSAYPIKAIGRTTLGPMLHALKLKLIVVVDDAVIWSEQPLGRRIKRGAMLANGMHGIANMRESRALTAQVIAKLLRKHARKAAPLGGRARASRLTPNQRKRIAKNAAKARWHKPKLIEVKGDEAQQLRKQLETQLQKPAPNGQKTSGALTSGQRIAPSRARSPR